MRLQVRYFVVAIIFVLAVGLVGLCQWFSVNFDYFAKRNISYVRFIEARGDNLAELTLNFYNRFPEEK